jgi:hypothetical protein
MTYSSTSLTVQRTLPQDPESNPLQDTLDLGTNSLLSSQESMGVVLERAMAKLLAVVEDARAQLGIPEGAVLDTSPEATANRIADFALNFFENWLENDEARLGLEDQEARQQFVDFIGAAIQQGIDEARGILESLQALNGDVESQIDNTAELVQQRLEDFVLNG